MDSNGLDQLHDLQLPPAAGWWPPAPGWWLLAVLLLFAVALFWHWWRGRGVSWLDVARDELGGLAEQRDDSPEARHQRLMAYSRLLRRMALATQPRELVAPLTGERWLGLLDELAGSPLFSGELGRLLSEAPYRPDVEVSQAQLDALQRASRLLLKKLAARRQGIRPSFAEDDAPARREAGDA